jgi:outer membrane protein
MRNFPDRLLLLFVAIPVLAFAADGRAAKAVEPLTLPQARRIAMDNNPQIKADTYAYHAAEEDVVAARSFYLPQVNANMVGAFAGAGSRIAVMSSGLTDPTVLERGSGGVAISQLVTDFGRTIAQIDASRAAQESGRQHIALSRARVVLAVTIAYFEALRAEALTEIARSTLQARDVLLQQVSSLRDVQMKSDLDLSISRQGVDAADLLLLREQNARADAMAQLSQAMGYAETHDFTLSKPAEPLPPLGAVDALVQTALTDNPELAALRADAEAARQQAEAAKAESYPTLNAMGFAGLTPYSETKQPIARDYAVSGFNLSIPLFAGGRLSADADKAAFQAHAAEMRFNVRKNELIRDIQVAFDRANTAYKNMSVTQRMHQNAILSLQLTRTRYDIGLSSIVDLYQVELAETEAAAAEADAGYDYLEQRAVLDYVLGKYSLGE